MPVILLSLPESLAFSIKLIQQDGQQLFFFDQRLSAPLAGEKDLAYYFPQIFANIRR